MSWDYLNSIRARIPLGYWFIYDVVIILALLVPEWPLRLLALAFLLPAIIFDVIEVVWKQRQRAIRP
jgi:hypothetical protein